MSRIHQLTNSLVTMFAYTQHTRWWSSLADNPGESGDEEGGQCPDRQL